LATIATKPTIAPMMAAAAAPVSVQERDFSGTPGPTP
jgi:hypothetical protein